MNSFLASPQGVCEVRGYCRAFCGSTELRAPNDWLILTHHAKPRERDFRERQFEQQERPSQLENRDARDQK
jgi:hypothetical protein